MFFIGIFTTHIPFIAFVVFYLGFFLFGAVKHEIADISYAEVATVKKVADIPEFKIYHSGDYIRHNCSGVCKDGAGCDLFAEYVFTLPIPPCSLAYRSYPEYKLFTRPPPPPFILSDCCISKSTDTLSHSLLGNKID